MKNLLWNAAFLELASRWVTVSGGVLAVDEDGRGAPGRAVLRASRTVAAVNDAVQIEPATASRIPAAPGETFELSGGALGLVGAAATITESSTFDDGVVFTGNLDVGAPVAPRAFAVFYNAGGSVLAERPLTVRPPEAPSHGLGVGGVRASFYSFSAREIAPANTASVALKVDARATATTQAVTVLLLKPFVGRVPPGRTAPLPWGPGGHDAAELAYATWPEVLRPFQNGSVGEAQAGRIDYQSGASRPKSRRIALDPARRFKGQVRCDAIERAVLDQFWREGPADFWIIEPDSDRLCLASWTDDGAPAVAEMRGPTAMVTVGLWMETA